MTPSAATNGATDREKVEEILTGEPLTTGYRPTAPLWAIDTDWVPQIYLYRDVEVMITHPIIRTALRYYAGGISHAEFEVEASDPRVQEFVNRQIDRFWSVGMPPLQGGYEYGWCGAEVSYKDVDGTLSFDCLQHFSPRDSYLLTRDKLPVGVRVKNVLSTPTSRERGIGQGQVDLFMASEDVPAKGLWYVHQPRYNPCYGQSQLLGAWRPWRRLAWKDGAETTIDTGVYRFAFAGPEVGYPDESLQPSQPGIPATTIDTQGRPVRHARDVARQIAEWAKAGAGIGLPSTRYPPDLGGGEKWYVKWPEHVINVEPLIGYAKWLQDQIYHGIGVPPELLEAGETGSGYSGRVIPMEAFLASQQKIADAFLWLFCEQVLNQLVRWNFGRSARYTAKVKDLLESKRKAQGGGTAPHSPQGEVGKPGEMKPPDETRMPGPNDNNDAGVTRLPGQKQQPPGTRSPYDRAHAGGKFSTSPDLVTDNVRRIAGRILRMAA